MSDDEAIEVVALALLDACVELRKETGNLSTPEREADELRKFVTVEEVRLRFRAPTAYANRLLANAEKLHGRECADQVCRLVEHLVRSSPKL